MPEQTLAEYLNEINADGDTVQQAFRYLIAQQTDDLPTTRMHRQLVDTTDDATALATSLTELEHSSAHLEQIALLYLSDAWDDPDERPAIRSALKAATQKLPVIETGIMAVVAMYGMYLLATRGRQHTRKSTKRSADGAFETVEDTTYASPSGWLKSITNLVSGGPPPVV